MNGTHSSLDVFSATHADRSRVIMNYMVEDFCGLNLCGFIGQPKPCAAGPVPDDATRLRLHGLANLLKMTRDEAERWYSEYWLVYTVMSAYARPLHNNGWGFIQTVARLDTLTQRASTLLPRLRMPGFECLEVSASSLVMRLREDRPRSARFLHGLLRRLATDFGAEVTLSEPTELSSSAIRVTVTAPTPAPTVRIAPLPAPVRQMRPTTTLPIPPRRNTQPAMTA